MSVGYRMEYSVLIKGTRAEINHAVSLNNPVKKTELSLHSKSHPTYA